MTKPKAITIDTALRNKVFWVVGTSPESFTNMAMFVKLSGEVPITIDTALRNKVFWVVGTSPESFTNIAIKEKPNEDNRSNTIPLFLSLKVSYLQLYQLFIPYLS